MNNRFNRSFPFAERWIHPVVPLGSVLGRPFWREQTH